MKMNQIRLIETLTTPINSFFTALQAFAVPWQEENINLELDSYYIYVHSGQKQISGLVNVFIGTVDHKLSSESLTFIANILFAMYGKKWKKLWDTLEFEYNPISNYDMTERMIDDTTERNGTETIDESIDSSGSVSHGKTDTTTNNLLSTENNNRTTTRDIQGFNSDDYVPSDKTAESTVDATKADTGTQTTVASGTDRNTNDTDRDYSRDTSDTSVRNYTLTRSGNIGVTTSQQMIESERKLWLWNFFKAVVFPDLDDALTIEYYGGV